MNPTTQSQEFSNLPAGASLQRYVRFGPFHLDLEQRALFKDGERMRVQSKVCEALIILVKNSGEVVTRETLRARMWPTDTDINYDANVNTTVNKLRQALGDTADRPMFVETIPRKGYTFIAAVEGVAQLPAARADLLLDAPAKAPVNRFAQFSRGELGAATASSWFTAGLISLVIAAVLFGAAITLFAYRGM